MYTGNVNLGWTTVCNLVRWPVIWIGGYLFRSRVPREKCFTCGLMPRSGIFLPRKIWPRNGKNTGKTRRPGWFILSGRIILFSIVSFSRLCWKPMVLIYYRITCRPTSSWIWKEIRFPLPGTGRCGCTSISWSSPVNKMCYVTCWRQTLLKLKITTLPGKISKLGIIASWWLSMETSLTVRWCWRKSILPTGYRNGVSWRITIKKFWLKFRKSWNV